MLKRERRPSLKAERHLLHILSHHRRHKAEWCPNRVPLLDRSLLVKAERLTHRVLVVWHRSLQLGEETIDICLVVGHRSEFVSPCSSNPAAHITRCAMKWQ